MLPRETTPVMSEREALRKEVVMTGLRNTLLLAGYIWLRLGGRAGVRVVVARAGKKIVVE